MESVDCNTFATHLQHFCNTFATPLQHIFLFTNLRMIAGSLCYSRLCFAIYGILVLLFLEKRADARLDGTESVVWCTIVIMPEHGL